MQEGGGKIPKIIHQIWLGKNPRPLEWMDSVKDFAEKNGYEYRLWTEKDVKNLDWDSVPGLRPLYDSFKKEMAGKADIIRMLALYDQGGVYIDADSVIMKPEKFGKFLERNKASVFFGWEDIPRSHTKKLGDFGPELRGAKRLVANGTIGSASRHPFMKLLLNGFVGNSKREAGEHAWRKVGPLYVTRVYQKVKEKHPDVKIYPMRYFYPRHWRGIRDPALHKKVRIPGDSMLFQYGYTTNGFADIFRKRNKTRRLRRHSRHKSL